MSVVSLDLEMQNGGYSRYIDDFCDHFYCSVSESIEEAIKERQRSEISLDCYTECVQHLSFTKIRCKSFYGREEQLNQIKDYITGNNR